jgi:hypothetical protein
MNSAPINAGALTSAANAHSVSPTMSATKQDQQGKRIQHRQSKGRGRVTPNGSG